MSYSVTSLPLVFCSTYADCTKVVVDLPFGLPQFSFDNPCCEGLNITLDQLEGLLRPLYPFLKLLDCAVKLISITMAIPDAIGPPPDVGKIVELVEAVAQFVFSCLPYILSLIPIIPTAIIAFCRMIRGISQLVVSILSCLKKVFFINLAIAGDILSLQTSNDKLLINMGICLKGQNDILNNNLLGKLGALLNVFTLINLVLQVLFTFIPPLKKAMTSTNPPIYPITPNYSAGIMPPALGGTLDTLIVVFTVIAAASNICAGGS